MPKFKATIMQDEDVNSTGIPVPANVVEALGSGKKPKVSISFKGYTYRTTVAVYGGEFLVPLAKVHREAARWLVSNDAYRAQRHKILIVDAARTATDCGSTWRADEKHQPPS